MSAILLFFWTFSFDLVFIYFNFPFVICQKVKDDTENVERNKGCCYKGALTKILKLLNIKRKIRVEYWILVQLVPLWLLFNNKHNLRMTCESGHVVTHSCSFLEIFSEPYFNPLPLFLPRKQCVCTLHMFDTWNVCPKEWSDQSPWNDFFLCVLVYLSVS